MQQFNNHIVVPVDFSEQSIIALKQSYNIARLKMSDITLLHVIDSDFIDKFKSLFTSSDDHERMLTDSRKRLEALAAEVESEAHIHTEFIIREGKIYDEIIAVARELNAAFIVMGTSGATNFAKKLAGSNAVRVINEADCPVISIKGKHHRAGCKRIILPLDISEETRDKVMTAIELAQYFGSEISIISIYDTDDEFVITKMERQMVQVQDFIANAGVKCAAKMMKANDISETVIDYSAGADGDLVVIMSQQETGVADWILGSEAQQIINNCEIPVCSVKPIKRDNQDFVVFNV